MTRTRLRRRLFWITALNATILLGLTLLLTWRARESHREVNRLLVTEGRVVTQLQQLQRAESAFGGQWNRRAGVEPESLPQFAARYSAVVQLSQAPELQSKEFDRLRNEVAVLANRLLELRTIWPVLAPEKKTSQIAWVSGQSEIVRGEAERLAHSRQLEIERRLPTLETNAEQTMIVSLAIVYIIAIFSFVVAKLTLKKVVNPIEVLVEGTEAVKRGEFGAKVPIGGDYEIAQLAHAFNDMSERLGDMTAALRRQASTDELTGLPNFRSFQSVIDGEVERASRYEQPFGILVIDIDHFKKYNDAFGHQAGNDALQQVARVIRKTLRTVDTPARYGGEEFVAIIPHIDARGLASLADRVRRGIEALPATEGRTPITASIGGALFPIDGQTRESLFEAADKRLYDAKSAGRNRSVVPDDLGVSRSVSAAAP